MITLYVLLGMLSISNGTESKHFEAFIEDVIETWQLRHPTILFKDDLPKICMVYQWLLCLSNEEDTNELANHLATIHKHRKQDGLIIVGNQGHEKILKHVSKAVSSFWTSNSPAFIPISYQNKIKHRLDSNIIFYSKNYDENYELLDVFAVKRGPHIRLKVGKWNDVENEQK